MSRGPGKLQRAIFDVLASAEGSLKTSELLEELAAFGLADISANRKASITRVLRACHGLVSRGALTMKYGDDLAGHLTCRWEVRR
jgi:hypothetical protein